MIDPNEIYEKLAKAGEAWADKDSAASLLEETKKTLLSQLKTVSKEKSDAAKETDAMSSEAYREHISEMVKARKEANKAKVQYDAIKIWVELKRSEESTRRAEMTLR